MKKIFKPKKGFTLIELLVTIAIIGLLSTIIGIVVWNIIETGERTSNKITSDAIKNATLNYIREFRINDSEWYDNPNGEGQFACTTLQQLINKGFFKSDDVLVDSEGNILDKNASIKVVRDNNKVIESNVENNSNECDRTKPTLKLEIEGLNKEVGSDKTLWYYDNVKITLKVETVGFSGISEYIYTVQNTNQNIETTEREITKNVSDIVSDLSGKDIEICGTAVNGNGLLSDKICKKINIDLTTPETPTLISSDNIISDKWHKATFDLNVSGGGTSPSGTYYNYRINTNEQENIVSNNKITSINSENNTYSVKTCNNVGRCSAEVKYIAKVDTIVPNILSFKKSTEDTVLSLDITAIFNDELSGVVKYKINKSSSYVNNSWTTISSTKNELTYSLENITANDTYYVWVEDAAGNYNKKQLIVDNIDREGPVYSSGGSVSLGSVTNATFTDKSTPITVYYLVNTTGTTPSASSFASTSRTFTTTCGKTYHVYAKAVDRLGNYTIKKLGSKASAACCSEGTYSYYDCTAEGYKRNRRYNECTSKYEYQTTTTACQTEETCGSWGSCQSSGKKYRTCYYYYGGIKNSYQDSETCCSEGTYSYYDCTSRGYKRNRRYNGCTGSYEYQTTTTACYSEETCGSWGSCQSSGKKYRTCYYYHGGTKTSYEDYTSCTYSGGSSGGSSGSDWSFAMDVCTNSSSCSAAGYYGGGQCSSSYSVSQSICPNTTYYCKCCKLATSTFSGGNCYKN